MFIVHGFFPKPPSERLLKCVSQFSVNGFSNCIHEKQYLGEIFDFSKSYSQFEKNITLLNSFTKKVAIVPPSFKIAEFYAPLCDFLIVRFPITSPLTPPYPLTSFKKVLEEFLPLKNKTLIELSGECTDFDMLDASWENLSYNQAILKCSLKGAKTFFIDSMCYSYYTYLSPGGSPRLVFLEDTLSISTRHNLIKEKGYRGIAWKNVSIMADGNWESLRGVMNKI